MGERPTWPSPASPPPTLPVLAHSPNRKPSSCGREAACLPFGEQRAHTHPNTHPVAQCFSRYANVGRPCLSRTTGNASAKQPTYHKSTNEMQYRNRTRLRPDSTVFANAPGHLRSRQGVMRAERRATTAARAAQGSQAGGRASPQLRKAPQYHTGVGYTGCDMRAVRCQVAGGQSG